MFRLKLGDRHRLVALSDRKPTPDLSLALDKVDLRLVEHGAGEPEPAICAEAMVYGDKAHL